MDRLVILEIHHNIVMQLAIAKYQISNCHQSKKWSQHNILPCFLVTMCCVDVDMFINKSIPNQRICHEYDNQWYGCWFPILWQMSLHLGDEAASIMQQWWGCVVSTLQCSILTDGNGCHGLICTVTYFSPNWTSTKFCSSGCWKR